jgi:hypothetical protein
METAGEFPNSDTLGSGRIGPIYIHVLFFDDLYFTIPVTELEQ